MVQPAWFEDVPPNVAGVWQASNNSGGSWFAYTPGTNLAQVVGPTGTQRFRRFFTVPTGQPSGTMSITWSGDIYEAPTNIPGQLYIDGVLIGNAAPPGASGSVQFPVPAAGTHEIQIWVGQANSAGLSRLDTVNAEIFNVIPCDCCPTSEPRCALLPVQFTGVSETVAEAGWTSGGTLPLTIDNVTATATTSGYNSPAGTTPSTTLRVTYTHSTPQNRVRGLRLWNQGGNDLNDSDGLGTFTADFYAGVTLLATLICNGANGGAAQTFTLPTGIELSAVTSVVLRSLGKLSGSTVAPLWRELQLLEFQTVFPCRRSNGTLEWYSSDGVLIPSTDVVDCETGASQFVSIPDLRMTGAAFGDGPDPLGENICNVIPSPSATTGFTLSGVCYDPTVGGPTMDWVFPSGIELEYGNPPRTSGGVFMTFSSPTLGNITWPTNNTDMAVGSQRTSNVFGGSRRAVLTYLSGPAAGSPSQTIRMTGGGGGSQLSLHLGTTDNTTPAIRFRIDFTTA